MRRRLVALLLVAGSAGCVVAAAPASAYPLCYGVRTSGTVAGSHPLVDQCVAYAGAVNCQTTTVGIDPSVLVTNDACAPRASRATGTWAGAGSR